MIRLLLAAAVLAAVLPAAHAQTVPVEGADLDISYSGDGIVVESAVLDAIGSIDLEVTVDDASTLQVTIPEGMFDSLDPSRVEVLADFVPVTFDASADGSGLQVSFDVDVTTTIVQIIYDDGAGPVAAVPPGPEPPDPEPVREAPPEPETPDPEPAADAVQPDPEPPAPADVQPPARQDAQPDPAPAPPEPRPEPDDPAIKCGEGTYLRDGACVPSCGPGLVLRDDVCVVAPTAAPAPANTRTDLVYGVGAGFAVAFAVLIVLWAMARASRRQHA